MASNKQHTGTSQCTECSVKYRPNCKEMEELRKMAKCKIQRDGFNRRPIWKGVSKEKIFENVKKDSKNNANDTAKTHKKEKSQ